MTYISVHDEVRKVNNDGRRTSNDVTTGRECRRCAEARRSQLSSSYNTQRHLKFNTKIIITFNRISDRIDLDFKYLFNTMTFFVLKI